MPGSKAWLIVPTIVLLSAVVTAQDQPAERMDNQSPSGNSESRFELFGGYSYEHVSPCGTAQGGCGLETGDLANLPKNYNGWNAAATFYLSKQIGITADFTGHYATQQLPGNIPSSLKFSRYSYMFGPVFPIASGRGEKASPFVHVLFGAVHQSVFSTNGFNLAAGGGLDYKISKHVALRIAQVDYEFITVPKSSVATGTAFTNGFRYAGGIVIK